jgi:hypothetical protein
MQAESCEPHERSSVAALELRLPIGEAMERLQHQNAEHQHSIC